MSRESEQPTAAERIFRPTALFVCAATLLPFSKGRQWWVRIFDFPRVQLCALGAAMLAVGYVNRHRLGRLDQHLLKLVSGAVASQLIQISRYTPLAPRQVTRTRRRRPDQTVSLLAANVLMTNREPRRLLEAVRQSKPDLVLLLEPDQWWMNQVASLDRDYPYSIKHPLPNTYGIALYSKLPLVRPEVRFLIQNDVPSIRTGILLRDGREVAFYGVHPKPPGRLERKLEISGSGPRDAELVVVAQEIQNQNGPIIVAGDFNDVAWSHTTRRFQRIGRLLDPRVGRGFYNTFHAQHPLLRFPLDHLFHSKHFALVNFGRQPDIGSDHFPIYVELSLEPQAPRQQEPPRADSSDHEEAGEVLDKEQR